MEHRGVWQKSYFVALLLLLGLTGWAGAESWYYFPMAADGVYGAYGSGFGYCTRYTLVGDSGTQATIVFRKPDGTPMNVTLHCPEITALNGTNSAFTINFSQSANRTVSLYTWGEYTLQTGWAYIWSYEPLYTVNSAYCFYKFQDFEPIVWEAAIFPAEASTYFFLEANVSTQEPWSQMSVNTGIAVANPHDYAIDIDVSLGYTTPGPMKTIHLPALGQTAVYLSALFSDVSFSGRYVDRVRLFCSEHFFVMGMRALTNAGQTICSTLPVTPLRSWNSYQLTQRKPNNTYGTANTIVFSAAQEAMVLGSFNSSSATERGSYHVYLPAGVTIRARFLGYYLGSNARCTDLQIWDGSYNLLASGTITAADYGNEADLTYTTTVAGNYWIDVVGRKSMIYNASDYLLFLHYE